MIELTPEQSAAVLASPGSIRCRVAGTEKEYVLIEASDVYEGKPNDCDARTDIKRGLADAEAGRVFNVEAAEAWITEQLRGGSV